MPLKRQPKTLYKHCIEMSIYAILMEWRDRYKGDDSILFSNILPVFPPSVLNSLVSDVVDIFVQTANSHGNGGLKASADGSLSDLLECVLLDRLTSLDLSPLARLETIAPTEVGKSEKIILKSLSCMNNLVSLSFKANRNTPTIPVCGDELLKEIGFNCPKLRSLDVSYNHTVTNVGLEYLWGHPYGILNGSFHQGCPDLKKLTIFGCAVTAEGVAKILEFLKFVKFVGYKETGTSITLLNKFHRNVKLNLVYLNNMGCGMKTIEDLNKLHYSCKMSHMIFNMCPYIMELKVRVTDATLEHVLLGPNINSIHLIFDIGKQLAVGRGMINLVKNYGAQLTTLSLVCSTISTDHLLKIGKYCYNLETFTIKCGQIYDPDDILYSDFKKYSSNKNFTKLENLFFTVLTNNNFNLGIKFLPYIVFSSMLKNFYFSLNSTLFTNSWVEEFFTLFDTQYLETFVIDVPTHVFSHATLTLTMASVDHILAKCPQIKTIGNLFAWCISVEEMKELCRLRELENSDLDFIYHPVPVHMNFQNYN